MRGLSKQNTKAKFSSDRETDSRGLEMTYTLAASMQIISILLNLKLAKNDEFFSGCKDPMRLSS